MSNLSEEEIIKELESEVEQADYLNTTYVAYDKEYIRKIIDLYNKEKEKNKELIEGQVETIEKIIQPELLKKYISKDKIREKLKYLDEEGYFEFNTDRDLTICCEILRELLEGK